MLKCLKWALVLVMATCVVTPPAHLAAQSGNKPLMTAHFLDYRLGNFDVMSTTHGGAGMMEDVKMLIENDSTLILNPIGHADATPFQSCRGNAFCSAQKNQVLADQRASSFARLISKRYGIDPSRIIARGEVAESRGGQYRGVTLYVRHRETSTVVQESSLSLSVELNSLRLELAALRDSMRNLSHRVTTDAATAQTNSAQKPTVIQQIVTSNENTMNVDVGLGGSATRNTSTDALVPTASIFIKPNAWPVEFFATGGIRPYSSTNICKRADVIGTIGANVHIGGPVFTSIGGYTDREMCRNGGPKTNERFLTRNNGVFAGLGLKLPKIGAIRPMVNLAPTYSWTTRVQNPTYTNGVLNQNQIDSKGWGMMSNITFRLDGNWNKKH